LRWRSQEPATPAHRAPPTSAAQLGQQGVGCPISVAARQLQCAPCLAAAGLGGWGGRQGRPTMVSLGWGRGDSGIACARFCSARALCPFTNVLRSFRQGQDSHFEGVREVARRSGATPRSPSTLSRGILPPQNPEREREREAKRVERDRERERESWGEKERERERFIPSAQGLLQVEAHGH